MQEQKVIVQRWPFDLSSAHVCEGCNYVCAPNVAICPKCRTVLGEFSMPVKIDAVLAAAMATAKPDPMPGNQPWDVNPAARPASPRQPLWDNPAALAGKNTNSYIPDEVLTRCPHCGGIIGIGVRAV